MDLLDLSRIPLAQAPPGSDNLFEDGPSQSWMPRLAIYITLPLATALVVLRLYTRLSLRYGLGTDDYLCIAAMAASAGFCGVMLEQQLDDTYGRHYWDVPVSAVTDRLMQETCAISAVYCWAAALTKLSLCALYLRLFSPLARVRIAIWVAVGFIAVGYVTLFAVWIAYSVPRVGQSWTDPVFFIRVGRDTPAISITLSALSVFTDFQVLLVPLMAVSGLALTNRRKVGLAALFATGLLACAFCVAGLPPRISIYRAANVDHQPDPFWTSTPAYALGVAEINLGIICSCIPVCVPLFRGWRASLASTVTGSYLGKYWSRYRGSSGSSSQADRKGAGGNESLPRVPKGNLKTLLSFIGRGGDKSNTLTSASQQSIAPIKAAPDIELARYDELRSIDVDYHTYLTPPQKASQGSHGRNSAY